MTLAAVALGVAVVVHKLLAIAISAAVYFALRRYAGRHA